MLEFCTKQHQSDTEHENDFSENNDKGNTDEALKPYCFSIIFITSFNVFP